MRFHQLERIEDQCGDDLASRLRALDWPEAEPEVRLRCWQELERKLGTTTGARAAENGRADFSRRRPALLSAVVSARIAAFGGLSLSTRA